VFENRVLRRIFGPKRDKVTGECMKLHNEELHNLYSSPNIFTRVFWESPKESHHSEDLGVYGRMGPDWIFLRLA
jgi:hypothetical protein